MKKLTLALACASTLALFAAPISVATFEGVAPGFTGLSGKTDAGENGNEVYWQYMGDSGTADSSVVTAYGDETLPRPTGPQLSGTPGKNYLELSTEGGTLWRSVNPDAAKLGAEETITAAGIYVDTMVQFTATEGDDTPEVGSDDQIAIWLKSDGEGNTCLCVRAAQADDTGTSSTFEPKTYVLADTGSVKAGQWYRLTVKAIADADQRMALNEIYTTSITGFQIYLDGKLLHTEDKTYTEGYMALACDAGQWGWLTEGQDADDKVIALLESGSVFPSLKGEVTSATFQAVGFKGSGAIDDVVITEDELFGPTVAVTGVTLNQTTAEITVGGETLKLTATVAPENATDKTVKWETSNPGIATVDGGVVTAVAAGEVTITATAGDKSATCTVTVKAKTIAVTGVTLPKTAEITVGKTLKLTAEVAPADATDKTVTWKSADEKIATVDADGVVTAVAPGEVTITATAAGGKSATCTVTVKAAAKPYPEYIAEADKAKYDAWVSAYKVTDRADTDKALQAAYLLNVAPGDAETEKAKFVITSITVDAQGNVTVVASQKNSKDLEFNGTVEILGATALDGEWGPKAAGHKFFKAVLK